MQRKVQGTSEEMHHQVALSADFRAEAEGDVVIALEVFALFALLEREVVFDELNRPHAKHEVGDAEQKRHVVDDADAEKACELLADEGNGRQRADDEEEEQKPAEDEDESEELRGRSKASPNDLAEEFEHLVKKKFFFFLRKKLLYFHVFSSNFQFQLLKKYRILSFFVHGK